MKKVKLFEEFISEVSKQMISGTSGRTITTLDNRKYELKKDVKDAKIGNYINVVLPKGTIITNLPGGVFANHKDLKDKYCTGYKSERWDEKFGVGIRTMPDTLEAIEDNSKVLESISLEETLNELHLSSAGVKDFLRAVYNSNTSILQKLNFKNFRGLTDYIKGSDIEEFDELRDEAKAAGLILAESTLNEAKKQKFVLYTNPNNSTDRGYVVIGTADVREILSDAKKYSDSYKILYQGTGTQDDLVKAKNMFSDYRFGEESIDETVELVHVYDTKGELQGTGELVKTRANKSLIRWDGSSEEWIDSKLVKLVEGMISPKMANGFKIGNKIKTQKGTYTITGFGSKTGATRDFEAENEDIDLGHEDNEPHMIKGELYRIGKYAMELYQMMDSVEGMGEVDLPAWWQSKITTAKNMISGAKHYLEFELKEPAVDAAVDALTGEESLMIEDKTNNSQSVKSSSYNPGQFAYKLVPKKIKGSGIIVKQLFEKEEEEKKNFQLKRIEAFKGVEEKLNNIYAMISNAKNETIKYYKENPNSYVVIKPTDLITDYLEDIEKLLKNK